MTAMGIIGIILASAMALVLVSATVYALYNEIMEKKQKRYNALIDRVFVMYEGANRNLIRSIVKDSVEMIPEMVGTLTKAYEKNNIFEEEDV